MFVSACGAAAIREHRQRLNILKTAYHLNSVANCDKMLEEFIRDGAGVTSSQPCGEAKPELHLLSEGRNHTLLAGSVFSIFLVDRSSSTAGFAGTGRGGAASSSYIVMCRANVLCRASTTRPVLRAWSKKGTAVRDSGVLNSDLLLAPGKYFSHDCAMPGKYPKAIRTRLLLKTRGVMSSSLFLHERVLFDVNEAFCCPKRL